MTIPDNTTSSEASQSGLDARVALFRCADILADIARQLSLNDFANTLRQAIGAEASALDPAPFARKVLEYAQRILVKLDKAIAETNGAGSAAGSGTSVLQAEARTTKLQDCRCEICWCIGGIKAAAQNLTPDGRVALPPYPVHDGVRLQEFQAWVREVKAVVHQGAAIVPQLAQMLAPVIQRLESPTAVLIFGGRFKSGKSSLLNAALGRPLLPTKDLAETGVSCHLSFGRVDQAILQLPDGQRNIDCSTEAIRQAISLRGGHVGTERTTGVLRLNLQLRDFPSGSAVEWVDPPGMFDRPEMTDRAWASVNAADVIIWVLRSQQFLGESEAEAIAELVDQRGPASVCFIENAFLATETDDPWGHHLAEVAPVNRAKLSAFAADLGLGGRQVPRMIVVSALEVLHRGHSYGAGALQRLLGRLGSPGASLIRRARLQWLMRTLDRCTEIVQTKWAKVKAGNAERIAALEEQARRQEHHIGLLNSRIDDELARFLVEFSNSATAAGEITVALIGSNVMRDQTYTDHLNRQLKDAARTLFVTMLSRINDYADSLDHACPHVQSARLEHLLIPPDCQVTVANNSMGCLHVMIFGFVGAMIGTPFFGIGAVPGCVLGSVVGLIIAGQEAKAKDCAETKNNVRAAVQRAIQAVQMMIPKAKAQIHSECLDNGTIEVLGDSDLETEHELSALFEALATHRRTAETWLKYEIIT